MSAQSFKNIKAVNFGTQGIAKVLLGTTQVWPAVNVNVRGDLDLSGTNWAAREREWNNNFDIDPNGANPLQTIQVKAGANILNVISAVNIGLGYDAGSLWLAKSEFGNPYGTAIDPNAGFHGDLQARYGGLWKIPAVTKPGDVLYAVVGQDPTGGAQFAVAKIEFKA